MSIHHLALDIIYILYSRLSACKVQNEAISALGMGVRTCLGKVLPTYRRLLL